MPLANALDLTLLGASTGRPAFIAAQLGDEVGFATLPDDGTIADLLAMRMKLEGSFYGKELILAAELEKFGERLGQVLLADVVGDMYASARAKGVRISLVINDCELQRLPWEYLHGRNELPGPQANRAVVRIVSSGQEAGRSVPARPAKLNVLLLVSRPPNDDVVPLDELTKRLATIFSTWLEKVRVNLTVRPVANFAAITRAVEEKTAWDVIHFLGHGEVRTVSQKLVAGLVLSGEKHEFFLDALRLGAMLDGRSPRLLVLSACATGQTQIKAQFANLAHTLLKRNVPAVVANQMVITAESIAEFCTGLYTKLLDTGDIDEAVGAGRLQSYAILMPDNDTTARVEWGVPVLYRHFGAQLLFK